MYDLDHVVNIEVCWCEEFVEMVWLWIFIYGTRAALGTDVAPPATAATSRV